MCGNGLLASVGGEHGMANIKVMHLLTKEMLQSLYWDQTKSAREIAAMYRCDKTTILDLLRKHDISRRSVGGGRKKHVVRIERDGRVVEAKACGACGEVKPLDEYDLCAKSSGGRQPKCNACRKAYYAVNNQNIRAKTLLYYYAHRETIRHKRQLRYRLHRESILFARRQKYEEHRELHNTRARRYYAERKEAIKEREKRRRQENPEKYRAKERARYPKRRAQRRLYFKGYYQKPEHRLQMKFHAKKRKRKIRSLPFTLTAEAWNAVLERYGFRCALSGVRSGLNMEHFIPVAWGHGGTYVGNVYPVYWRINRSKSDTNPFVWAEREDAKGMIDMERWERLVEACAAGHGLTVERFRQFVDWCEANPRSEEDIVRDPRTSLDIWLAESTATEE